MIPEKATIKELAAGLREKQFSSVELTKQYLAKIERDSLNAFITANGSAIEAAKEADAKIASGDTEILTGIPIAVKDVLATKGIRTTAASKMLEQYVPPYTATAVQRLLDKGMVLLGKTNCDEFAMGASNEYSAFGPVKNPHDTSRVAGGSSGGSAVAVAADYAPVSLGTDTGGSIRLPASFCGVIGLRTTYGRVSRSGLIAMASSFDQIGTFSRNASDAAIVLRAMAGFDSLDATSSPEAVPDYDDALRKPFSKLTIGIPKEYVDTDSGVGRILVDRAKELYQGVPGVTFVDVSLPHASLGLAAYYICVASEVSANLARYDGLRYGFTDPGGETIAALYAGNRGKGLGPEVKRRVMLGTYSLSAGYLDQYYGTASKVRRLIQQDFEDAFRKVDLLLTPTSPTPAFKIGEKKDPLLMYLSDVYLVGVNLAGLPAISYPAGEQEGLPLGLQLIGPKWSEAGLLQAVQHLPRLS